MHTKVLRGLRIRDTPILDQPHSLKLELACELPSLHDTPPVPSKHLTRCPRNRVQASGNHGFPDGAIYFAAVEFEVAAWVEAQDRVAIARHRLGNFDSRHE